MELNFTKDEEKIAYLFLDKIIETRKETMFYKNNANSITYGSVGSRYSKDAKDVSLLINNLLCSLDTLEEVVKSENFLVDNNLLISLVTFSYKHLKLSDKQITDMLFYIMKRNFLQDSFRFLNKDFRNCHFIIKENYFDKQQLDGTVEDFSETNLKQVKLMLDKLGIHKKLVQRIIKTLPSITNIQKIEPVQKERNSNKSISKKEKSKPINSTNNITAELYKLKASEPILSKKEYFKINSELLEYFYFDYESRITDKVNNSIMINKEIYASDRKKCISLLKKVKYDISTIKTFLEKAFIYNKCNMNVLAFYNDIYEILINLLTENYVEYSWIEQKLKDINNIILEMQFADDNTYCFCMELIKVIIDEILESVTINKMSSYYLKREKIN